MEDRENRRKILYIVLGIIVIILLFFMIKSCGKKNEGIVDDPLAISTIKLSVENMTLTVGDSDKLSYTILPSDTTEATKWLSSNEKVVSVDSKGNIKALSEGNAVITLVSEKGGVFDSVAIKVVSKKTEDGTYVTARLLEKDVFLKVGSTKKLDYELDPIDSKYIEVSFESNNSLVATVSNDGVVTGVKSGVTSVDVKIVLSDNSVITDTATVTVEDVATLYMTTTIPDIKLGETIRLSAALSDSSVGMTEGNVKVSNDNNASISNVSTSNGYLVFDVKGLKAGNTTLKLSVITSEGKTLSLDVPITVVKFSDLYISSGNKEILVDNSFILSGRLEPSVSGALETECKSSNEKIVTVSSISPANEYNGACQITGIKKGSANVTITISGQKKTIKVTVNEVETEKPSDSTDSEKPGDSTDNEKPGDSTGSETPGDSTDDPTGSETPGDSTDDPTDNPGIENPGIGSASLSVSLDKTEYAVNEEAVITVVFTDEYGVSKNLEYGDYVTATDFDSTSSGTKKLVVVYPYKDESLKAEVEYTVGGDDSSNFLPSGGGYYSSSGGVSSSAGGVNTETFTITALNNDGVYKDKIPVKVNNQSWNDDKYDRVLVAWTCKDEKDDECKKFLDSGKDLWSDDSPFVAKSMHKNPNGELEIEGEYVTMFELDKGKYEGNANLSASDSNFDENLDQLRDNGKTVSNGGKTISAVTDGKENVKIEYTKNNVDIGSGDVESGEGGDIIPGSPKYWKKSADEVITVAVNATARSGYRFDSFLVDGQTIKSRSYSFDTSANNITVSAYFINNSTGKFANPTVLSINVEIDDEIPKCTAKDDGNGRIIVNGDDSMSGVKEIKSLSGLSGGSTNENYVFELSSSSASFSTFKFEVTDNAGNVGTCSAPNNKKLCYSEQTCKTCAKCFQAGCLSENEKPLVKYNCKIGNRKKNIYISLMEEGKSIINLSNNSKYEYVVYKNPATLALKFIDDSMIYTCTPEDDHICAQKPNLSATTSDGKTVLYSMADDSVDSSGFNANCALCGCAEWNDIHTTRAPYNETNVWPRMTTDSLAYLEVFESRVGDKCDLGVKYSTRTIILPSGLKSSALKTYPKFDNSFGE